MRCMAAALARLRPPPPPWLAPERQGVLAHQVAREEASVAAASHGHQAGIAQACAHGKGRCWITVPAPLALGELAQRACLHRI